MLEDIDFWINTPKDVAKPQAEADGKVTDPSINLEYRAQDKPTTTDPARERTYDIESILADIRRKTEYSTRTSVRDPLVRPTTEPSADQTTADEPPAAQPDDKQVMREMLLAMRELTEEVKHIRSELEARPHDAASYPSERPSGIAAAAEDVSAPEIKPEKKNKALSIISSVLFYTVIVAMVLGAFLMRSTSKGSPFMLAGFSAANVLTSSMEDVYPRGSLIITKSVDAKELQIGDDITFMVSEDSSITHRIIGITENYQGTGSRAFQTKGTKNPNPDKEMVAAANVVGKVIFHSKALGDFANFVKKNWPILIFVLIVIIALITFLKWNAKKFDEDDENDEAPKEKPKAKKPRSHTKKRNKLPERRNENSGDE